MANGPTNHQEPVPMSGEAAAAAADPASVNAAVTRQKMLTRATIGLGTLLVDDHCDARRDRSARARVQALNVSYPIDTARPRSTRRSALAGSRGTRSPSSERPRMPQACRAGSPTSATTATRNSRPSATRACTSAARTGQRDRLRLPLPRWSVRQRGRRTAGPPVRPLNRYETSIDDKGHLILGQLYALDNTMRRHQLKGPGQPVDGPLSDLYPEVPQG